jgi:hypothetical protein
VKKLDGTMLIRLIWLSKLMASENMNLWFPYMENFWSSYRPISFSRTLLCVGCGREVKEATCEPNHTIITSKSRWKFESEDSILGDRCAGTKCCHCYSNHISLVLICNREWSNYSHEVWLHAEAEQTRLTVKLRLQDIPVK